MYRSGERHSIHRVPQLCGPLDPSAEVTDLAVSARQSLDHAAPRAHNTDACRDEAAPRASSRGMRVNSGTFKNEREREKERTPFLAKI